MNLSIIEWFRDQPVPQLAAGERIVVGGTSLLAEFLQIVGHQAAGGQLLIAAPFVADHIAERLPGWKAMPHSLIDVTLVTSSAGAARRASRSLRAFPWRSCDIRVRRRLHAKVYVFHPTERGGICLIGSHNLTRAGSVSNQEAGVLFVTAGDHVITPIIHACSDRILQLARAAERFMDTTLLPLGVAA